MVASLSTEIIRDGRFDLNVNPRERFRFEFDLQNDDESPINLTGATVELLLKPLDLAKEAVIMLNDALDASATPTVNVSAVPTIFPQRGFVKIDEEIIRYDGRTSSSLDIFLRADDETDAAPHAVDAKVTLAGRVIDKDGPTGEKLTIDAANGKITAYISQPTLNSFTWQKAEYRLWLIDTAGDPEDLIHGFFTIDKRWAQ